MSDKVIGNLKINLDFDSANFSDGITRAKRELSNFGRATRLTTDIARKSNFTHAETNDALKAMQRQYAGLMGTVGEYDKRIREVSDGTGKYQEKVHKLEASQMRYKQQMVQLADEYDRFQREALIAQHGATKFGQKLGTVGGVLKTTGAGMKEVGSGLTQLGVAGTATIGALGKVAIDFERGQIAVQKTTNASAEQMEMFNKQILEMAKIMPVPIADLQALAAQAGQLGVAQNDIAKFTESMAKIGTATNMSAEEAGNAFARFTNITGTGISTLDNLGSAVVHLGNNFATTESAIMDLALNMAGSLTVVGASEADILGISTAMSAVGITAERGGSAMSKFFIQMQEAVSSGSDSVQTFARVAGMSADEFTRKFQEDATSAIVAFITGLGQMHDSGQDTIGVLGELGIKEVRLRDTILRLATGHETLNKAMDASHKGYTEGSALNEEYNTMLQGTGSQIEVLKNKLKAMAIEAGQTLLPVIVEILEMSGGLMDTMQGLVSWFTKLDDGTKKMVVQTTLWSLALGKGMNILGSFTSGLGGLFEVGSKLFLGFGRWQGGLQAKALPSLHELAVKMFEAGASTDQVASAMAGATSAVGELGGEVATTTPTVSAFAGKGGIGGVTTALTGSGGLIVALQLAAGALAVFAAAWTIKEISEATERYRRFGRTVSKETEEAVNNVQSGVADINKHLTELELGYDGASQSVQKSFNAMAENAVKEIKGANDETLKELEKLPPNVRRIVEESIKETSKQNEAHVKEIEELNNKVSEIVGKALEENRELTETEVQLIEDYYKRIGDIQIEALGKGREETKAAQDVLEKDMKGWSRRQLRAREKDLKEMLRNERDYFQENKKTLKEQLESGVLDQSQYDAAMRELERTHERTTGKIAANLIELARAQGKGEESVRETVEAMGLSYDKGMQYLEDVSYRTNKALIENAGKLEGEAKKASDAWNDIILENKIAYLDTNAEEKFIEMARTEEGWEQLKFINKEANLDTNQREFLTNIIVASNKWHELTFEERVATLRDNSGDVVQEWLMAQDIWWDLDLPEREAIVNSNTPEEIQKALEAAGVWETLSFEEKVMLTQTNAGLAIQEVLETKEIWDDLDPETRMFLARTNLGETEASLLQLSDLWDNLEFREQLAEIDTNAPDAEQEFIDLLNRWNENVFEVKDGKIVFTQDGEEKMKESIEVFGAIENGVEKLQKLTFESNAPRIADDIDSATASADNLQSRSGIYVGTSTNVAMGVTNPIDIATGAATNLENKSGIMVGTSTNAKQKVQDPLDKASSSAIALGKKKPKVTGSTNADSIGRKVDDARKKAKNKTFSITGIVSWTGKAVEKFLYGHAQGTNFHPGGLALVNDEQTARFRELITLPNGMQFIPQGRNVMLNLPRGTQVLRASRTANLFPNLPQFAEGTGLQTMSVPKTFANRERNITERIDVVGQDNSRLEGLIEELIQVVLSKNYEPQVVMDGRIVAQTVSDPMENIMRNRQRDRHYAKGRGI